MRIVITGAGGFVGRQLVPLLLARGAALLLVGRQPDVLRGQFPQCAVAGYEDIPEQAAGYDLLLHLAVVNNDQDAAWAEVERANVDLAVETCLDARRAGIGRFCFVSSTLALDDGDTSPYAISKRLAEARLTDVDGIAKTILYFPAVVGDRLAGKLALLNGAPKSLRAVALRMLGALKPTVRVDRIADAVMALAGPGASRIPQSKVVSDGQRHNIFYRIGKRVFDIGFALSVLLFLWWAMIIVWVLVRTQSEGPGIFRQIRVGRGEREFACYKFRTMLVSTPNVGTHHASADSVTSLGRFLRRTKLDELPQVFNILLNQMSLVGPRPCLPNQLALIEARRVRGVYDVTPGITGLAQIQGIDMSDPERLAACDERYVGLQTLLLDLKITIRTFMGGGSGDRIGPVAAPVVKSAGHSGLSD